MRAVRSWRVERLGHSRCTANALLGTAGALLVHCWGTLYALLAQSWYTTNALLGHCWYVWCTVGHYWRNFGALLGHYLCTAGARLVHHQCTAGTLFICIRCIRHCLVRRIITLVHSLYTTCALKLKQLCKAGSLLVRCIVGNKCVYERTQSVGNSFLLYLVWGQGCDPKLLNQLKITDLMVWSTCNRGEIIGVEVEVGGYDPPWAKVNPLWKKAKIRLGVGFEHLASK